MEISNALILARRAKENNDSENAKKYYELILLEDPNNWEASFYTIYFDAMSVSIQTMPHKTTLLYNSIPSALKLVKETVTDKEEQVKVLETMSCDIIEISTFYSNAVTNFQTKHSGSGTFYLQPNTIEFVCLFADTVYTLFADNELAKKLSVIVWKHAFTLVGAARFAVFKDKDELVASLLAKIRVYEPDFYKKEEEEKRKEEEEKRKEEEEKRRQEEEKKRKAAEQEKREAEVEARKRKISAIIFGAVVAAVVIAFIIYIVSILKPSLAPDDNNSDFDPASYLPLESVSMTVTDKDDSYKNGEYVSVITFDIKNTGNGDFTYIVGNIEFYNGTELVASGQTYFTGSFDSNKTVSIPVEYSLGDFDGLYETSLENLEVIFKVTGIRFEGSDKLYEYNELSINISK